jgi:long-subunit fatty acid transport protein
MRKIILTTIIILQALNVYCSNMQSGAAFLKISPGAKPSGMGGAYSALSGDINCLYYNPAGIASITKSQIGAMHTEWVDDIRYDFAAGAFNLREGVLGVSATLLTMGEIEGRGANREVTGNFTAYDFAVQFSYAKSLNNNNTAGGSLKFIRQSIDDEIANGVAVDIGLQRKVTGNLNLGISVRNLGPKMKFISEGYNLPLTFVSGVGLNLGGITIAFDANYEVIDENLKFSLGTEYVPMQFLSLRGGYFLNAVKSSVDDDSDMFDPKNGLGGGLGLNILDYNLDYAVVPYSELGTTQRISFQIGF